MFLLALLVVNTAHNPAKYNAWLCVVIQPNNGNIATMKFISAPVNEPKTEDAQGQRLSNRNLSLFVCFSDVYRDCKPFPSINYAHSKLR